MLYAGGCDTCYMQEFDTCYIQEVVNTGGCDTMLYTGG